MINSAGGPIWVGKIECTHKTLVEIWGRRRIGRGNRHYRRNLQRRPSIVRHVSVKRIACGIVITTGDPATTR